MSKVAIVLIATLLILFTSSSAMCIIAEPVAAPRTEIVSTEPIIIDGHRCGFIPPAHVILQKRTIDHWVGTMGGITPPHAWDWRDKDGVSAVKDQGYCGSCYAFGFAGQVESLLMINGANETNLSENNIKEGVWRELIGHGCPSNCWGSCDGGNALACANLYSTWGSVDEITDPYTPVDVMYDYGAPRENIFTEWHLMSDLDVPETAALKAVVHQQPVYTTIDATCLSGYDGTYVIESGSDSTNHAVMIVGWNDSMGSSGAWICKNSWGTGWGDDGFFYIGYGIAGIGKWTSYSTEWHEARGDERLYYYDEGGWSQTWTYGNPCEIDMLVEYIPGPCENATAIEFWATDFCTDVDVELFANFDGSTLSNPLPNSAVNNLTYDDAGYYSIEFDQEVSLAGGDPIYVWIHIAGPSHPIPTDDDVGPYEPCYPAKMWAMPYNTWEIWDSSVYGDFGVRMRTITRPSSPVPEIPTLAAVGLGICMIGAFVRRRI